MTGINNKTLKIVMVGVFAAVIAVLSQVAIPLPSGVPVTLQTLAIALCGYVLGAALGGLSTGVYLALGAVGVPVFANLQGGVARLVGLTGGFLWGFLPMVILCGLAVRSKKPIPAVLFSAAGLLVCHALGVTQYAILSHNNWWASFLLVSMPYLLKDAVSMVVAYGLAAALRRALTRVTG